MTHEPHDERALLHDFLSGRDVSCPGCGYNLRNSTADRCAECGLALILSVGKRPRVGPFVCVISAIAAPVGFAATVSSPGWYRVYEHFRHTDASESFYGWGRPDWINLGVSSGVVVIGLLFLRIATWLSRRFIDLPRPIQWPIALLAVILSSGTIVGLLKLYARIYLLDEEA